MWGASGTEDARVLCNVSFRLFWSVCSTSSKAVSGIGSGSCESVRALLRGLLVVWRSLRARLAANHNDLSSGKGFSSDVGASRL